MALRDNLISWWSLNEASGTRNDSHGTNHLTDNNTVGSTTGKLSNAAVFSRTASESLSITNASQTGLGLTGGELTISTWLYIVSQPANNTNYGIAQKWGSNAGYYFTYTQQSSVYLFNFTFWNGTTLRETKANYTLNTSTWYHVTVTVKASTQEVIFYVNAAAETNDYVSGTATSIASNTAAFYMGALQFNSEYSNIQLDEYGVWSRVLTPTEITTIYNSGTGLDYAGTAGTTATFIPRISFIM